MVIKTDNLCKTYKRGNKEFYAVRDVCLEVLDGDFVNIIGRSGSGKSTLINMIAGMITPSSGEILVAGNEISKSNDDEISNMRNEVIGFIPQGSAILSNLTVLDNVKLPFFMKKREGDVNGRAMYLLKQLGIEYLAEAYPRELSGGEQRRVLIARALINEPKVIIADEPTADLDIETTREVMQILQKINIDLHTTVLIVSHELDTLNYGNKVYTMASGELSEGKHI